MSESLHLIRRQYVADYHVAVGVQISLQIIGSVVRWFERAGLDQQLSPPPDLRWHGLDYHLPTAIRGSNWSFDVLMN